MNEVHSLSPERLAEMRRVSSDMHYQIAMGFDEADAEGTAKALMKKYPGIVMKVVANSYIKNTATLEALGDMIVRWQDGR